MEEKMEENLEFTIDDAAIEDAVKHPKKVAVRPEVPVETKKEVSKDRVTGKELINCLSNKKVTVQYLPLQGTVNDPKHVMYGGLAENASITLTVPRLRSGLFKNILTDDEKAYLESVMGLEVGALNVYNKNNNFWDNSTAGGISKVRLTKQDTILDLSSPTDYIKYKILLANNDLVAPNQEVLQDKRKATYRFVLITENEVHNQAKVRMNNKIRCYTEYGKIMDEPDVLRAVIELLTAKPLAANTKLDFLLTKTGELIEANPRLFLSVVEDPLLRIKVLIQKCVEFGFITRRGDYYYLKDGDLLTPMCEGGADPVLSNAAKYLGDPRRQETKFSLEAKIK